MPFLFTVLLAAPVSLENRVSRLPDLIDELGTKGGLKLAVSRELAHELIYVRAKPRRSEEWMRLVAEAVSAEWESDSKTLRLVRPSTLKRRLEGEEIAERSERYASAIRKSMGAPNPEAATAAVFESAIAAATSVPRSPATGYPESDDRMAEIHRDLLPWQRFLRRILRPEAIGAFARVPPGYVDYWSTRPSPVEKPLRIPASTFALYDAERSLLTSLIGARPGGESFMRRAAGISYGLFRDEKAPRVQGLRMRVERPDIDQVVLNGALLDHQGGDVERFSFAFPLALHGSTWPNYPALITRRLPQTPRFEAIRKVARNQFAEPPLASSAMDPVKNEPGEIFARPLLDVLCEQGETEAILALPDEAIAAMLQPIAGDEPLGAVAERLEASTRFRVTGGLVVGRPRYPLETTKMRLDRIILRDLLRGIGRSQGYKLDTVAAYCNRQSFAGGMTRLEALVLAGAGVSGTMNEVLMPMLDVIGGGRETLRFYDHLPAATRQALWHGESIPFSALPANAQESLRRRVYGHRVSFPPTPAFAGRSREGAPTGLPSGIPAGGFVKGRPESHPAFVAASLPFGPAPAKMDVLGYLVFMRETRNPRFNLEALPDVREVPLWPIRHGTLALRFHFTTDVALDASLHDYAPVSDAALPYARFPAEFRAISEEILRAMRERAEHDRQLRNGGAKTPPPRS